MHWEAFVVIGVFTIGLGVLLFVPAWLWVKRRQRANSVAGEKLRLTKMGWLLVAVLVVVLIGGFSLKYIAPESLLGQAVRTSYGRFLYAATVAVCFGLMELVLKIFGIKLVTQAGLSHRNVIP